MSDPARRSAGLRVAAIIPALDEERSIARRDRIASARPGRPRDRGRRRLSRRNRERLRAAGAAVVHERRRGYGRACLSGAEAAEAPRCCCSWTAMAATSASRRTGWSSRSSARPPTWCWARECAAVASAAPWRRTRRAGNRVVAAILNRRFRLRLTDIGPFRAIRATCWTQLAMHEMTYGWPTEMIRNAARCGDRVIEVPVDYRRRRRAQSKVRATARLGQRRLAHAAGGGGMSRPGCWSPPRRRARATPRPGMCPPLGLQTAARLGHAFLTDAVTRARTVDPSAGLLAPVDDAETLAALFPGVPVVAQQGTGPRRRARTWRRRRRAAGLGGRSQLPGRADLARTGIDRRPRARPVAGRRLLPDRDAPLPPGAVPGYRLVDRRGARADGGGGAPPA